METKRSLYDQIDQNLKSTKITLYKKGDIANGVVEKVGDSYAMLKIDGVFDAILPGSEMLENNELKIGDVIKIFILKPEDEFGSMVVSQRRTTTTQRWDLLEEAYKTDQVVEVNVVDANSGGLIVNIDGVMGFIPTSLLDPNKVYKLETDNLLDREDIQKELAKRLAELIGTKIKVKVVELDKEKGKVIFSEKLYLVDQSPEFRQNTISSVKVGDVLDATVTAVTNYGIFVNAGGLDGLIHVSEISWDKVENPLDYAKVGDKIKVKLIDIGDNGKRVAYSIKQLTKDPWSEFFKDFKVGSKVKGVITNVEDYGLIVKIGEGVTGLVHKTELNEGGVVVDPRRHYKVGEEIEAVIVTISPSDRKVGLSVKKLKIKEQSSKSDVKMKRKLSMRKGSLNIAEALAKAGITLESQKNKS